jgi:hypothetical protein
VDKLKEEKDEFQRIATGLQVRIPMNSPPPSGGTLRILFALRSCELSLPSAEWVADRAAELFPGGCSGQSVLWSA